MNGIEAVTTTGDPAFAVDREGRILAWNEAAEHALGHRRSEVLGRHCWQVLEGRDLSLNRYCTQACAVREMALRGEPIRRTQMHFRTASGDTRQLSMSTLVLQGKTGKEVVHLLQPPQIWTEESGPPRRVSPAATVANDRLTRRQIEVLGHLGEGRGTNEIAERLGISQATTRHHIQHILTRLKVHSRLEAVTVGRRIGLI